MEISLADSRSRNKIGTVEILPIHAKVSLPTGEITLGTFRCPGSMSINRAGAHAPGVLVLLAVKTASSAHLEGDELLQRIVDVRLPLQLVADADGTIGISAQPAFGEHEATTPCGLLPPLFPEWLGDRRFLDVYGTRFPYIVGEMARGIASEEMVIAAARHDILAFFGSAAIRARAHRPRRRAPYRNARSGANIPWASTSSTRRPTPALEAALVDRYIANGVRVVSASAFMGLTQNVVRYAARGLRRAPDGSIGARTAI